MQEYYASKKFLNIITYQFLIPLSELISKEGFVFAIIINVVAELFILSLVFPKKLI